MVSMAPSLEYIVTKILSVRPELSKEEIMRIIEEKERFYSGFLTRESAALSLAAELGITIEPNFKYRMMIKDLVSGLRDVTITGRVTYISQLKRFTLSDGRERAKRSMYITDKTGVVKVVLWDDKAISIDPENLIDRIVRLSHVSVRRMTGGSLILNAGSRSTIEIESVETMSEDYPPLTFFTKRINELNQYKRKIIDVLGLVEQVYSIVTFRRQSGVEGKVRRVEIADGTGKATLVLWDEHACLLSESHVGKYVVVFNVKVNERFDKSLELHSGNKTQIIVTERRLSGF
ncbi:MAG: hypothetical protein QXH24_03830 [Candidatus Bathyarchaeia archaeon]